MDAETVPSRFGSEQSRKTTVKKMSVFFTIPLVHYILTDSHVSYYIFSSLNNHVLYLLTHF